MLRERITHQQKAADTYLKAAADMVTGMGVVKDEVAGTFKFPTAATSANIYLVDKERIPTGINAARTDMSDYDEDYTTVKEGEYAKLPRYDAGERFSTDQYATTLTDAAIGKTLHVGTDGKWAQATAASVYKFVGWHDDAGHKLADIVVLDTAVANATGGNG